MYFEFADSEVAQCIWDEGRLQLRFAAARLRMRRTRVPMPSGPPCCSRLRTWNHGKP